MLLRSPLLIHIPLTHKKPGELSINNEVTSDYIPYSVSDERGVRISVHGCKNGLGLCDASYRHIYAFVGIVSSVRN